MTSVTTLCSISMCLIDRTPSSTETLCKYNETNAKSTYATLKPTLTWSNWNRNWEHPPLASLTDQTQSIYPVYNKYCACHCGSQICISKPRRAPSHPPERTATTIHNSANQLYTQKHRHRFNCRIIMQTHTHTHSVLRALYAARGNGVRVISKLRMLLLYF